jgi:formylglycine-generating enzyme required for sulfatase activity/serine/threonine protein kinase
MDSFQDDLARASIDPVQRFAGRWNLGYQDVAALDSFLDTETLSSSEFVEVLRGDLKSRWRHGKPVPVDDYVARLAGDPPDPEAVLDLVYTEYLVREELGQPVAGDDYCRRFPAIAEALRDQLSLHAAMNLPGATLEPNSSLEETDPGSKPEQFPRMFGRYRLLSQLGRGGMGTVYLADDTKLDRRVAIKIPRADRSFSDIVSARFAREARTGALLNHPQLCPVFDVGQIDGVDFLTMPYIAGGSLADVIKSRTGGNDMAARADQRQQSLDESREQYQRIKTIPPEEAARLIIQVALALAVAHQAGVVHRDLKPANILLTEGGEPVITDFGLALRAGSLSTSLTEQGVTLGSVTYMPPGQVHYDADAVGPRSDVYSLGAILYELLTGRPPFIGSRVEILRKTLSESPVPPSKIKPELDPRLDGICLKALAKMPEDRFASMTEFADQLSQLLKSQGLIRRKGVRSATIVSLVAVVLLSAVGVSLWSRLTQKMQLKTSADQQIAGNPQLKPDPRDVAPQAESGRVTRNSNAADGFQAGTIWKGQFSFLPPHTETGDVTLIVTERTGKTFRGEYVTIIPYAWMVNGTIEGSHLRWTISTPLSESAGMAVAEGGATVTGDFTGTQITAIFEQQSDRSRSKITLERLPPGVGRPTFAAVPFNVDAARAHQEVWAQHLSLPVLKTNVIGMKLRLIPPGVFTMGASSQDIEESVQANIPPNMNDAETLKSEAPRHSVLLSNPYYIGIYEVTQGQYESITGQKPSRFAVDGNTTPEKTTGEDTSQTPVEMVSWIDAVVFCNKLSEKENLLPAYQILGAEVTQLPRAGYRLPTEAEWEFACRAGTNTRYWTGDKNADLEHAAWLIANSGSKTHSVGLLKANPFGLYDTHGNVREWVQDWWAADYYQQLSQGAAADPQGAKTGTLKVSRGGQWNSGAADSRSANRHASNPTARDPIFGFRVVLEANAFPLNKLE